MTATGCFQGRVLRRLPATFLAPAFLALAVLAIPSPAATGEARAATGGPAPARIVSVNVCTDQLVMLLAERERIRSVSWLARDPDVSRMADEAAALPVNYGQAEEILPLRPDLVVASAFSLRPTVHILRRIGIPVLELPVESSIADIRSNVRRLADALGRREQGEALLDRFDRQLRAVPRPVEPVRLAIYWENGGTSGRGTLADALIEAAGLVNAVAETGLAGSSQLPIERVVLLDVDLLVLGGSVPDAPAQASAMLRHPALRRAFAGVPRVAVPAALWLCGTPTAAIDLVTRLAQAAGAVRRGTGAGR